MFVLHRSSCAWVGRSLGQGEQIRRDPELSVGLINLGQAVLSCSELLRAAQSLLLRGSGVSSRCELAYIGLAEVGVVSWMNALTT